MTRKERLQIEQALETWHGGEDKQALHNATLSLIGEFGELVNLYRKHLYKPKYDMHLCVCGFPKDHDYHTLTEKVYQQAMEDALKNNETDVLELWSSELDFIKGLKCGGTFRSRFDDELGDVTYYMRVIKHLHSLDVTSNETDNDNERRLLYMILLAAQFAFMSLASGKFGTLSLYTTHIFEVLEQELALYCETEQVDYDDVVQQNYEKLTRHSDNHGWSAK